MVKNCKTYQYDGRISLVQHSAPYLVKVTAWVSVLAVTINNTPHPPQEIVFAVEDDDERDLWHSKQFDSGFHCTITVNEHSEVISVELKK